MIVERFKNGDPIPVYQRLRERGRLAPEGLHYVSSWVDSTLATCYQVIETSDAALIEPSGTIARAHPETLPGEVRHAARNFQLSPGDALTGMEMPQTC
jgi:hypothetical protein